MAVIKITSCNCVRVTELSEDKKLPISIYYYDEEMPQMNIEGGHSCSLAVDGIDFYEQTKLAHVETSKLTECVLFEFDIDASTVDVSSIKFRLLADFSAIDLTAIEYAGKIYKAKVSIL